MASNSLLQVTYQGEPLKGAGSPTYIEELGGYMYPGEPLVFSDSFAASKGWQGPGSDFANFLFGKDGGYHYRLGDDKKPVFVVEKVAAPSTQPTKGDAN